ncbi:perlucin-like protein [Saccostrea echinata]|uniref:perlucin-like protein n=1 Tax=Saccostrea echinata TaxID=191078 RepID=UPI002A7EE6B2|nr:perlucin-like protein [Saccostrea echinata]
MTYIGLLLMCWLYATVLRVSPSYARKACKPPFRIFGESCYYISRHKVTGDGAFARCYHMGGYLANFETLEEAMLMKEKLMRMRTGHNYFVGGRNINRRKPGGDWRWIKNGKMSKMTYFAFGARQPDGTDRAPQDCMFFYARERYIFHDVYCDHDSYYAMYICEK